MYEVCLEFIAFFDLTVEMIFIHHEKVSILVHILTDFHALIKIAEHSKSVFHKTGYNGLQCRNENYFCAKYTYFF